MSASGSLERGLAILEFLAARGDAQPLKTIADALNIPPSATHRLLVMLTGLGYIQQAATHGDYQLSLKLVSLGLMRLSSNGVNDLAQPILNALANDTGELARLALIEGDKMLFIAKAQGTRHGLRYDPDMGKEACLVSTASGHAWLQALPDEEALMIVSRQGFVKDKAHGPNAPLTIPKFLEVLHNDRERGYALNMNSSMLGIGAIAVPVLHPVSRRPVGSVSLAGPASRLTEQKAKEFYPRLQAAAEELTAIALHLPDTLESVPASSVTA